MTGVSFISHSQTFGPAQTNPFSINTTPGGYNKMSPAFADLDNDGDLDLMTSTWSGELIYRENRGTTAVPLYDTVLTNPFSLTPPPVYCCANLTPTFVDLDDDGDFDVFAGYSYATMEFRYFENVGTAGSPSFGPMQINPFSLTCAVYMPHPVFDDLDNDGDFDILSGESDGNFVYYENTGTSSSPVFSTPLINPFSLADVGHRSSPIVADMDNDGDRDIISGEIYGNFLFFENTGTTSTPSFAAPVTGAFGLAEIYDNVKPTMADLDADGDMDFMTSWAVNDLIYRENLDSTGTGLPMVEKEGMIDGARIYNASGNFMRYMPVSGKVSSNNMGEFPVGIYLIRYMNGNVPLSRTEKFVVIR
ncbi:MAG TPA: VCBS repeat-containing protein [Flavobacteriales bacterium]|nr:VCBS repeat-containing protein [Flavobacteriales bacterium]